MVSQLAPFNQIQFDRCMRWFASHHGPQTQYDLVKLHVMTDVFHVLAHGKPVIGGEFLKWTNGPVPSPAFGRLHRFIARHEQGKPEDVFEISPTQGKAYTFALPSGQKVDEDEFSPSEIAAMNRAWNEIGCMTWQESQDYFHLAEDSFMGKAYEEAGAKNAPLDWNTIIDAYDERSEENHEHIKSLIALGV